MKVKEEQVLKNIFWPAGKETILGNLIFSFTNEEMTETTEISISRTQDKLEIFYGNCPTFQPDEKLYFVQMFFDKNGTELTVDKKKTSPELNTDNDISMTLNNIQNTIVKMNTKPQFFETGVVAKQSVKLNMK